MNMKKINVLKPKFRIEEILDSIRECLEKGWTGMGYKTEQFENEWCKYTNLPNSLFLNSNTSGLHLALNVLKKNNNWEDGDEIITTPLTFISTNHSIKYENLTPVFADVDEQLCLDPVDVELKITKKTKAIMFVGIGGNIGQYKNIKEICEKYNLKLIFDAAHCAGTKLVDSYEGVCFIESHVGIDADVSVFSFQAVKNLPTADSGMICFKSEKDHILAKKLSWLGINKDTYSRSHSGTYKWKYNVDDIGFKYNGNSVMASMGLVGLKYLDVDNERRREIASLYDNLLKGVKGVKIINHSIECKSSRHLYQIRVDKAKRDKVLEYFHKNSIYPGVHYIDNTNYIMYRENKGTCPNAHLYSNELITLPIHLDITLEDINNICKVLKNSLL
jgi:dTDP-4-amino-4,6-dideoxygalactose transaminase